MGRQARYKRKRRELRREHAAAMQDLHNAAGVPEVQAWLASHHDSECAALKDRDRPGQLLRLQAAGWVLRDQNLDGLGMWDQNRRGLRLLHSVGRELDGQAWAHVSVSAREGMMPGWLEVRDAGWLMYPDRIGLIVVAPESAHVSLAEVAHVWYCLTAPGAGFLARDRVDMTCTARWATGNGDHRAGDLCSQPAAERVGDSDLCPYHFGRALDWFYKRRIELPAERQREHEESLRQAAEARRLAAEARSIVYYLHRTADGLIKIGTSTDHRTRFRDLRREYGPLRLLLAYAGGYEEETRAHNRFAAAHVTGEWFRPELSLLLEIGRLRRARDGQVSRLPEQVPPAEIRVLIRTAREQRATAPLTATLTATQRADWSGQERPGAPKVAG